VLVRSQFACLVCLHAAQQAAAHAVAYGQHAVIPSSKLVEKLREGCPARMVGMHASVAACSNCTGQKTGKAERWLGLSEVPGSAWLLVSQRASCGSKGGWSTARVCRKC
jgi:hypothetical protein